MSSPGEEDDVLEPLPEASDDELDLPERPPTVGRHHRAHVIWQRITEAVAVAEAEAEAEPEPETN